jgi:hypothetical protein
MMKREFERMCMQKDETISDELYSDVQCLYIASDDLKADFCQNTFGKENTPDDIFWKVRRCDKKSGNRDRSLLLTALAHFSAPDVSEERLEFLRFRLDLLPYEERAAFSGLLSWIEDSNEWYTELLCRTRKAEAMVVSIKRRLDILSNPV